MIGSLADTAVRMARAGHRRRAWLSTTALIMTLVVASMYLFLGALQVNPLASSYRVTVELPESAGLLPNQNVTLRGVPIGRVERELSRMQEEVRHSLRSRARLVALGEAVAKINHDLRNMLTSAQMASERLATSADPQVAKALPRLERALSRAAGLSRRRYN